MNIPDLAIIGAGPIGIELAVHARRANLSTLHFDAGPIAQTIFNFPPGMHFFSSNDRIAIADIPLHNTDQQKTSREQYLAYLRTIVDQYQLQVHTYQPVLAITPNPDRTFTLHTRPASGPAAHLARAVALVTGDTHLHNTLNIPGDDLPHVHTQLREPHLYFQKRVLVIGGKNSAVESTLRCYHAGALVTLSYRRDSFDKSHVKYWLLPELLGRIHRREIICHYQTQPLAIAPTSVTLKHLDPAVEPRTFDVPADFVLPLIGFHADQSLFQQAGITLTGLNHIPTFDPQTMQTNIPGLYVAGTATAGTQQSYQIFLENCHIHTTRIIAHLKNQSPPPPPTTYEHQET